MFVNIAKNLQVLKKGKIVESVSKPRVSPQESIFNLYNSMHDVSSGKIHLSEKEQKVADLKALSNTRQYEVGDKKIEIDTREVHLLGSKDKDYYYMSYDRSEDGTDINNISVFNAAGAEIEVDVPEGSDYVEVKAVDKLYAVANQLQLDSVDVGIMKDTGVFTDEVEKAYQASLQPGAQDDLGDDQSDEDRMKRDELGIVTDDKPADDEETTSEEGDEGEEEIDKNVEDSVQTSTKSRVIEGNSNKKSLDDLSEEAFYGAILFAVEHCAEDRFSKDAIQKALSTKYTMSEDLAEILPTEIGKELARMASEGHLIDNKDGTYSHVPHRTNESGEEYTEEDVISKMKSDMGWGDAVANRVQDFEDATGTKLTDYDTLVYAVEAFEEFLLDRHHKNVLGDSNITQEDNLPGGLADNHTPESIASLHNVPVSQIKSQLTKGSMVEFEHTDSHENAYEIAMDHLVEDPFYYTKLEKMEAGTDDGDYILTQIDAGGGAVIDIIKTSNGDYIEIKTLANGDKIETNIPEDEFDPTVYGYDWSDIAEAVEDKDVPEPIIYVAQKLKTAVEESTKWMEDKNLLDCKESEAGSTVVTPESTPEEISAARKLIMSGTDKHGRLDNKSVDDLFKGLDMDIVSKIDIDSTGHFYYRTTDGGVFKRANLESHPESVTAPRTTLGLAKQLKKNWAVTTWYPEIRFLWISKSNWQYHYKGKDRKDSAGNNISLYDVLMDGKVIGNAKDEDSMITVLEPVFPLKSNNETKVTRLDCSLDINRAYFESVALALGGDLVEFTNTDYTRTVNIKLKNGSSIKIVQDWDNDGSPTKPVTTLTVDSDVIELGRYSIWDNPKEYAEDIEFVINNRNLDNDETNESAINEDAYNQIFNDWRTKTFEPWLYSKQGVLHPVSGSFAGESTVVRTVNGEFYAVVYKNAHDNLATLLTYDHPTSGVEGWTENLHKEFKYLVNNAGYDYIAGETGLLYIYDPRNPVSGNAEVRQSELNKAEGDVDVMVTVTSELTDESTLNEMPFKKPVPKYKEDPDEIATRIESGELEETPELLKKSDIHNRSVAHYLAQRSTETGWYTDDEEILELEDARGVKVRDLLIGDEEDKEKSSVWSMELALNRFNELSDEQIVSDLSGAKVAIIADIKDAMSDITDDKLVNELESIVSQFESVIDVDDFNEVLTEFYDIADEYGVALDLKVI